MTNNGDQRLTTEVAFLNQPCSHSGNRFGATVRSNESHKMKLPIYSSSVISILLCQFET